jgi:thiamine pyrophosphate-dependent acetolactate synthase large subunit-like protein
MIRASAPAARPMRELTGGRAVVELLKAEQVRYIFGIVGATFLTPLDLGGLGFAFPVALGAKLGRPQAPVLAIHGDGGFLMNAQEIETAVRHGINVVTLVMNNNCWGSEKAYQKHFYGGRYIGCDIGNPRYDEYARLFGAAGYSVDHPDQVGDALTAALAAGKPAIIEVPIDPDEFPTPVQTARRKAAQP